MIRTWLAAIALFSSVSAAIACGTERWPVKTGTDRDAAKVATDPTPATIEELTSLSALPSPNSRKTSRFAPVELKAHQISGILKVIEKEKDEDYHLVIVDSNDEDLTMIVESPAPTCAQNSQFLDQITAVRSLIDQRFGSFRRKTPNIPVTVTGVAFFDPIHGQDGVASNGIELHPLLAIEFK